MTDDRFLSATEQLRAEAGALLSMGLGRQSWLSETDEVLVLFYKSDLLIKRFLIPWKHSTPRGHLPFRILSRKGSFSYIPGPPSI